LTPEETTRQEIDRQLEEAGWRVQDRAAMNISAASGVSVREFPIASGERYTARRHQHNRCKNHADVACLRRDHFLTARR
jgi:hypothetical protein